MQIVRTEVVTATAPNGQAILRVMFRGEGSECVTVDMARVDGDGGAALARALTILIQTAANFGFAVKDDGATSKGDLDKVAVPSARDTAGEVYVFEYRDGETARRIPPSRMPSFDAARAEAIRCAVDLLVDLRPGADALSGWLVRVSDENGKRLYTVDVAEAEAARWANK